MSAGLGKCSKIRHIVRLRQILHRWHNKSRMSSHRTPSDVPAGHMVVCVGINFTRYVVRVSNLNHPVFKKLLVQAEEEYGFSNHGGPLAIPCEEVLFEEVLRFISRSESSNNSSPLVNLKDFHKYCHAGINMDLWNDSRPQLHHAFSDKTIW